MPTTPRIQRLNKIMRRGPEFKRIGEKCCSCNNCRFPGEPRYLGDQPLSDRLFNKQKHHIDFFQQYGFLKWKQCVPLIIDDSPIRESGNQNRQVQITMLRLEDEFHYYRCLQVAKIFEHHRIGAYGKQNIRLFLIPMPFSHFLCAFGLLSYFIWVCSHAFLIEFWFRISHSVLLCEWCT